MSAVAGHRSVRAALAMAAAALLVGTVKAAPVSAEAPPGFVGINAIGLYVRDADYQEQMLSRMQSSGITVLRKFFRWDAIEPARGMYTFDQFDTVALRAAQHGMRLEIMLAGENPFSDSRPLGNVQTCMFPPADNADFADFARAVAAHYGTGGTLWQAHPELAAYATTTFEIWNEPGVKAFWGCHPNPAQYLALARVTAAAIRSVQPGAVIINGSAPHKTIQSGFWPRVFRLGAAHVFNGFGLHPYAPTEAGVMAIVKDARRLLAKFGAGSWPLYITEFGWATGGPPAKYTVPSQARQARLIKATYLALWRARRRLNVAGVYYYDWLDLPPPIDYHRTEPVDYWGLHTGLLNLDASDKLALDAVRQAAARMH